MMRGLILFIAVAMTMFESISWSANNFSCPYGTQGACLDYGDKVCSTSAKCVSQDAVCFNSYTCGFDGFICKSKYDDLVNEYDSMMNQCRSVAADYDDLVREYSDLRDNLLALLGEKSQLENCVVAASSLDEAQYCVL